MTFPKQCYFEENNSQKSEIFEDKIEWISIELSVDFEAIRETKFQVILYGKNQSRWVCMGVKFGNFRATGLLVEDIRQKLSLKTRTLVTIFRTI